VKSDSIPEGTSLMAEFELEGGRRLAAAEMKISVVAGAGFGTDLPSCRGACLWGPDLAAQR